jgi:hypothetical protein
MSSCRPELKAADGVLRLSLLATITLYDRQFTIAVGNDIDQCEQRIDERLCSPLGHLLSKHSAPITLGAGQPHCNPLA